MVRVSVVGWFVGGDFGCRYEPAVAHNYESATFSSPALDANDADCNADCDARQPLLSSRVSFVSAGTDKVAESKAPGCAGWRLWRRLGPPPLRASLSVDRRIVNCARILYECLGRGAKAAVKQAFTGVVGSRPHGVFFRSSPPRTAISTCAEVAGYRTV